MPRHVDASSPPAGGEPFEPNAFPLEPGVRLLEASAGTGKTFALAHLALRLVSEAAIPLRRLLVVTFTEAAAAELRERIGRRLQQALLGLQDPGRDAPDAVLAEWLERQRDGSDALEIRLLLALEELDGADITTIHGFCQRNLRRHALEARQPPQLALDTEGDLLFEQVMHTYWQEQVLPLPPALIKGLSQKGMTPTALISLLRDLDGDPGLELDPLPQDGSLHIGLNAWLPGHWQRCWRRFCEAWRREGVELMETLFAQARDWHAAQLPYAPYTLKATKKWNPAWIDRLVEATSSDPDAAPDYDALLGQEMLTKFLHPGSFCKAARANEGPESGSIRPPHPRLMGAVADLVDGPAELALLHACHWGRQELSRRRQRLGLCSYADLLSALDPGAEATGPTPLLEVVAQRYRAALIDEFQDTDPIQWRILRQAFGGGQHLLVMVGDPKQAIYRFRGGDLGTYLAARATAQRIYALRDNRRATPELIQALNQLGSAGLPRSGLAMPALRAKAERGGDGAMPLEVLWLGNRPKEAAGEGRRSNRGGGALPSASELDAALPEQVSAYVAELLRDPPLLREREGPRPVEPDDICLLVHTHRQAERLRQALQRLGVASRLVSQADVFATPAADALQRLLDALAHPVDGNRQRLLAASPLLGWSAQAIADTPPSQWSALAIRLQRMAEVWPRQGLLGPLASLLGAERMATLASGGRFLADLQQVAELVQQRLHRDGLGPQATARWLRRRRRQAPESAPEAEQTHSDKVRRAVAVVTVHRSKGLEYPVVICPYLWQDAGSSRGEGKRWHPRPGGAPRLDLHRNPHWGSGYSADQHERQESEAERERVAYVAVTRAMHRLVVAWGPAQGKQCNPLYPWLFVDDPLPTAEAGWPDPEASPVHWLERLRGEIERRGLPMRLLDPPAPQPVAWRPADEAATRSLAVGPVPTTAPNRTWTRGSYTSWTRAHGGGEEDAPQSPEALEEGRDVSDPSLLTPLSGVGETGEASAAAELDAAALDALEPRAFDWPERGLWADLPGGAGFGDCLHRVLEQIDYQRDPRDEPALALVRHELRRAGLAEGLAPPLANAIHQMLQTPFGGALGALRPQDLALERRLNELQFDLSLRQARAKDLARAFHDHPGGAFGQSYATSLAQLPVHQRGFLTGSIDLVFATAVEGEERWWVLDWKSNWLGRRDGEGAGVRCGPRDYGATALRALMASHHYPLQAHLYLVALHRYLRWRLPDYSPERHLGGYVYVFARGTPGELGRECLPGAVPGMLVEQPPAGRLLALDQALGTAPSGWVPGCLP
ncbi:MAG: UvrD-helicase domain-containing protein [Cyanobacteriota bacterium]|nr:UvrD-helicase domain-containing protein [Cyanobacteriota bacterium]